MPTPRLIPLERSASRRERTGEPSTTHRGSWKRKASWPRLRFVPEQTIEILIVGDPWAFRLPASGRDRFPPKRHIANVVVRKALTNPAERRCFVWEMSDLIFNAITCDPTAHWIRVTRYGAGKKNTRYEIEPLRPATESELELASCKLSNNLELVAIETFSRHRRKHSRWIA